MAPKKTETLIGEYQFKFDKFPQLEKALILFKKPQFKKKPDSLRFVEINQELLKFVQKAKKPCFLLPAIIDFIHQIDSAKLYEGYSFYSFEFWLNQHSGLNFEQNYEIRAKIVGKYLPRDAYQAYFPIGMGKVFPGSHFVTAHGSPDLDTTIASFFGWLDAFGAKVSKGLHIWNVPPGGILTTLQAPPLTHQFGKQIFSTLSQNRSSLSPSGLDFTTQDSLIKKLPTQSTIEADYNRMQNALVVVNDEGYFLGDIRSADYEGIRHMQSILNNCFTWFENIFQSKFISFFAKQKIKKADLEKSFQEVLSTPISECINPKHISETYYCHTQSCLTEVLGLKKGLKSNFKDFILALQTLSKNKTSSISQKLNLKQMLDKIFDAKGTLTEERPKLFKALNQIMELFDQATKSLKTYLESIEMALKIKKDVFGFSPRYVTPLSTLDEIQDKMSVFNHLTVALPNKDGSLWPLGIIRVSDIRKKILGTVTLRDFCNRDEVKIASYLEVISVMDHHKASLQTSSAPTVSTSDVQSCNTLLAELAFKLNDSYGMGNIPTQNISRQLKSIKDSDKHLSKSRIHQRLLSKKQVAIKNQAYFIDSQREFLEYLSFLYAIIDDTDLFSKMTHRDLDCIASMLNRMKSIILQKEVEIINFDDIEGDENFIKNSVQKLVRDPDMYSIYSKIFNEREKETEKSIIEAALGKSFEIFSDTKEQNGCSRISQTKVFSKNMPTLKKNMEKLLFQWHLKASEVFSNHEEIDLHIHMMSTICGADEVFSGKTKSFKHKDYLWIWIPETKQAADHLASFLSAFKGLDSLKNANLNIQFLSNKETDYKQIFKHHFIEMPEKEMIMAKKKMPIAVLSYDAGTLNSRKAQITPYLPLLVK